MRLDRLLANLGICSRSECRNLLRAGRVGVNGALCARPDADVPENAEVTLDGKQLDTRLNRHLMLHKPAGILTAAEDARQKTVMDLLPPVYRALGCMPVGRLDKDTTGLLLLTTDGEMNHRLLSPKRHVDKVYLAHVDGVLDENDVKAMADGMNLGDFVTLPAKLEILSPDVGRLTLREGKFHQVKRMFAALGKPVTQLHRCAFGSLQLDDTLPPGAFRELTGEETAALYRAADMEK